MYLVLIAFWNCQGSDKPAFLSSLPLFLIYAYRGKKLTLLHVNNKGADQPAHALSLISALLSLISAFEMIIFLCPFLVRFTYNMVHSYGPQIYHYKGTAPYNPKY